MHSYQPLLDIFIPTHYDLSLRINRQERSFSGMVTVSGTVARSTGYLSFHAKDLTIESCVVNGKNVTFSAIGDELRLDGTFNADDDAVVVITFSGAMTDTMHGMYPCYYQHDGIAKELVATQFESHHAREVFPCIDEPAAKATFAVTLTTETGVTALSNMPQRDQRVEDELLVTTFDTTPRMSTYLLAWVVGELEATRGATKDGIEVAIWSTPAQPAASRDFALDIAVRVTEFFDDYFGVPYPLPKADHIALPDFSSGAMENWGLITYREVALLVDPALSSIENKQHAAMVIAHELSHQWFGNLVTMQWWNDLWLNESFADMMEYVAIDAIEPDWNVWLEFASYEVIQALRRDSLDGVQSIQTDVTDPEEINSLFDPSIVYAKGGRLLHMLQTYIGPDALKQGLRQYFTDHAYQNTTAADLWAALSASSGQDIAAIMEPWIQQPGYPVVSVTKDADGLTLSQAQFFVGEHTKIDRQWPIPLASPHKDVPAIMSTRSLTVPVKDAATLVLNHESPSHYITHYSSEILPEVLATIEDSSPIDRLKLLVEQSLLAQAETIESADLLPLLTHYKNETSEAVWGLIAMIIGELKKFVEPFTPEDDTLRALTGAIASEQYQRLGWDHLVGETENDTKLRSMIISLMLYSESPEVINEALRRGDEHPVEELNPELRALLLSAAVRYSTDSSRVDQLLKVHAATSSSELRQDIAMAITSSKDVAVLSRALTLVKEGSAIRRQDAARWIVWVLRNREGRALAWQWVRDNWSWIEENFGGDKSYDAYPRYVASCLMTRQELEEFLAFFAPLKDVTALKRNIAVGTTELEQRVGLIERQSAGVRSALLKD